MKINEVGEIVQDSVKIWLPNWKRVEIGMVENTPWNKYPWINCEILRQSNSGKALLVYIPGTGDIWVPKKSVSFSVSEESQASFREEWGLEQVWEN